MLVTYLLSGYLKVVPFFFFQGDIPKGNWLDLRVESVSLLSVV